jgi:diguanylate cyclase (GGDEF)-like protein/PAS domain S-box-containing protein
MRSTDGIELDVLFDLLYASVPAMMHSIDERGRLVNVSDAWLSVLGYERHEVLGRLSSEFLTPESSQYAREMVLPTFFQSGNCEEVEYQMVCKDGAVVDVLLSAKLQKDAAGRPFRSIAVMRDVTQQKKAGNALVESESRYRALFEHIQAGFALLELCDHSGRPKPQLTFLAANRTFLTLCRMREAELYGYPLNDVFARLLSRSSTCLTLLEEVAWCGGRRELTSVQGPGGLWFDIVIYSPRPRLCALLVQDVTQRMRMQDLLTQQHEQIRVTLHSIGDAVISTDMTGKITYMNPVAERLTGWDLKDAKGYPLEHVFRLFDERTRVRVPTPVERCLVENSAMQIDEPCILIARDGSEFSVEDSASPIADKNGNVFGVVLVFRDVTDKRKILDEIIHRASHDALTGLLNRAEFDARLTNGVESVRRDGANGAVLYVDLDQFKLVNDTCGHAAGDALIVRLAKLLNEVISCPFALARLGGDEFGVILLRCGIDAARQLAETLCKRIDALQFEYKGHSIGVGASIGIVPIDSSSTSASEIMQAADSACYAAKDAGRNRIQLWSATDQAVLDRKGEMDWGRRLRQALAHNRFVLYAQRILPLQRSWRGMRCEILLRLPDYDESGATTLATPGQFLPAAERFHIASRIDRWVVHRIFEWMFGYQKHLHNVDCIFINLSGQSIGDSTFHQYVFDLLHTSSVDLRKICFEITETAAITNIAAATEFVNILRPYGIRFALDDFGSGASSFGYLKAIPMDFVKIDGQFVKNMASDDVDHAVVKSIYGIATALGKETIAECVENEAVASILKNMGIDAAQGHYFHRPQALDLSLLHSKPGETRLPWCKE